MSALTPADLAAARELCERATKGPYIADLDMFDNEIVACISNATTAILFTGGTDCVVPHAQEWTQELQQQSDAAWAKAKGSQALRDARFLAASRTLVPSLLDLVSQQAARIAELEGERDRLRSAAPVMLTALALIADEADEDGMREVALWYSERTADASATWLDAHRANEKDRTP